MMNGEKSDKKFITKNNQINLSQVFELVELFGKLKTDLKYMKQELNELSCSHEDFFRKKTIDPPKDLQEFEDRLKKMSLHLLKNSTYADGLISVNKKRKKVLGKIKRGNNTDFYSLLKGVLEKKFESSLFGQGLLEIGIQCDQSKFAKPQKNAILVQSAAQVLWYLEGNRIPTIEAMKDQLLNKNCPLFSLLGLGKFQSPRTIENWIRAVFPVPQNQRKKRSSIDVGVFKNIVPIPDILRDDKINFLKLRFALMSITRVLKTLGWQQDKIVKSTPIALLMEPLKYYTQNYALDWIHEAYSSNSSIFDP